MNAYASTLEETENIQFTGDSVIKSVGTRLKNFDIFTDKILSTLSGSVTNSDVGTQSDNAHWYHEFEARLKALGDLEDGWNGYSAPAPENSSIYAASGLLSRLFDENNSEGPSHMGATVLGGVGFTFADDSTEYVVEFLNDGRVIETEITETNESEDFKVNTIDELSPIDHISEQLGRLNFV